MNEVQDLALKLMRKQIAEAIDGSMDELLQVYLDIAGEWMLAETGRVELPAGLIATHAALALILFNRRGIEGLASHAVGEVRGQVFGEGSDLPPTLRQVLNDWRLLPGVARVRGQSTGREELPWTEWR